MPQPESPLLEAALDYATRLGWHVFPLVGKRPVTENAFYDATTDPEQIRAWWSAHPNASIGVWCRASGFVAIDADNLQTLATLEERLGELPRVAVQQTKRGMHVLFKDPSPGDDGWTRRGADGGSIRGKFPGGVDIKCNGYIVVEPSPDKKWIALSDTLPELPSAWSAAIKKPDPTGEVPGVDEWQTSVMPIDETEGARLCETLAELGARGEGESTTYRAVSTIFHGFGLSAEDGWPYLLWWNDQCGDPHPLDQLERQFRRIADAEHVGERGFMRSFASRFKPPDPIEGEPVAAPDEWASRDDIVREIVRRKDEPWIELRVGDKQLVEVRAGGIVTLQGGTGAGKSSLAANIIRAHCEKPNHHALVLSAELPFDEFGARLIGSAVERSWRDVLIGNVDASVMLAALPDSMMTLSRRQATLEALRIKLEHFRMSNPDAVLLVVVDYGQIVTADGDDIRSRVGSVWIEVDDMMREYGAVGLMVSQMSRAASKGARHGERLGADAIDGGAETAAIERWSTVVLEIGVPGVVDVEGWRDMVLSIAKGRMSGGDLVLPMQYRGRFGQWRITGDAESAAEMQAKVKQQAIERRNAEDDTRVFDAIRVQCEAGKPPTTTVLRRSGANGLTGVAEKRVPPAVDRLKAAKRIVEVREFVGGAQREVFVLYPASMAPKNPEPKQAPVDPKSTASKWLPPVVR